MPKWGCNIAKRFTDTNKYKKPFIRGLQGAYKVLWDFLYHDCDHAGIWIVDFEIAQILIGKDIPVNEKDALKFFNNGEQRIIPFDDNTKWFIPSFITFQYGTLNPSNRAHNSVIQLLKKHNISDPSKALVRGLEGCKDKDKDKNKDKDREDIMSVFDPPNFQEFLDIYPNKIDPDLAENAWNLQPEENRNAIIQGAREWSAYWVSERTEMKWIKKPMNFITNGTWKTRPPASGNDKSCIVCKAPYVEGGHKYTLDQGQKLFKCKQCRKINSKEIE